jgi:hypothetical protein
LLDEAAAATKLPRRARLADLAASRCAELHSTASHRVASHHVASHHIASHRNASHRIASHHVASRRVASHRIASHRITSHRVALCGARPNHGAGPSGWLGYACNRQVCAGRHWCADGAFGGADHPMGRAARLAASSMCARCRPLYDEYAEYPEFSSAR